MLELLLELEVPLDGMILFLLISDQILMFVVFLAGVDVGGGEGQRHWFMGYWFWKLLRNERLAYLALLLSLKSGAKWASLLNGELILSAQTLV